MEIKDLEARFNKVAALLTTQPWFKKEKWIAAHHPFPKTKPDGVTLHVYKKHWFNEDHLGIHFESYLDLNIKKQKKSYVTLHALHYDEFPETRISRKRFSQPLVDSLFDEVVGWDGYFFRAGKYGLQPFTKTLDGTDPQFQSNLFEELERLCKVIGPKIDQTLKSNFRT